MNKIVENLEKHAHSSDILNDVYGIPSTEKFDLVLVAPSWKIEKVFSEEFYHYTKIHQDEFSTVYRFNIDDKKVLYIQLRVGAPNIMDFCLACYKFNCENFIFLGSAGSLDKDLKIGDIIVPSCAISGNGSTLYLNETLDKNDFLKQINADKSFNEKIKESCKKQNIKVLDALTISVDSLAAEYSHLNEFKAMQAKVIDMETATFFASLKSINKKAAAILIISDNSANNEHLIGRPEDLSKVYHHSRDMLKNIISNLNL